MIKLQIVGLVGAFHFTVKPGGSGFDIDMPYPQILDVPMELGLELMAVIRPYRMDTEGKSLYHEIDELDCRSLVVPVINPQSPDTGGIVYGGVLEAPDRHAHRVFEH